MKYLDLLKEMFTEVTLKKNASLIPHYYHEDLLLYTNGQIHNYQYFLDSHKDYYASQKQYQLEYEDETFLEQNNKLAGRIWITVGVPDKKPTRLELILIVEYKDNKIYRLWELCYPDWSQLPEFQKDKNDK